MYNKFVSNLLDEMQQRYEKADNEYKKKILKRIIQLLEKYVD
jgi:hypothetical protein